MFLETSRYAQVEQTTVTGPDGKELTIIRRRRLPPVSGAPYMVKEPDRLDVIALRKYSSPTRFWHIADANTELWAADLLAEPGRVIIVPER